MMVSSLTIGSSVRTMMGFVMVDGPIATTVSQWSLDLSAARS